MTAHAIKTVYNLPTKTGLTSGTESSDTNQALPDQICQAQWNPNKLFLDIV
jgi:hypothetical protein